MGRRAPSNAAPTNVATVTTSTFDALNDAQGSATIQANEADYYAFTPNVSGYYRLGATAEVSGLDTVLGLFSSSGRLVAYNDDINSSNTNSQKSVFLSAGSKYYLGISNYSGSGGGAYNWVIDGPSSVDDGYEQNDTFSTASNLGTLATTRVIHNLVMNDGNDWYRFTTAQAGDANSAVQINFNDAQGDLDLELYNAAGARLGSSESVTDSERISLSGLAAGSYYVHALGYGGAGNPNYSLSLNMANGAVGTAGGVDLQGASVQATNYAVWGQAFNVSSTVRNAGTVAAGAFQTQWWLSRDSTWSGDDIILTELTGNPSRTISTLGAGATSPLTTVTLALPPASYVSSWTGSTFYIVMRTDSGNTVAETNETNNSGQIGSGLDYDPIVITNGTTSTSPGGFQITLNVSGMTASQQAIFQQAANRWSQIIVGDLPNATYAGRTVDDLLIDATGASIDGVGGVLGQAGPDAFRSGSYLPIHGSMEFDTADLASMEANGTLLGVIEHEMGHVLGIGTIWTDLGLLRGAGTSNPIFTGVQATAQYNRIFNTNASGVPVENGGGAGTRDSHWRESILNTEIMTGYVEASGMAMPLSAITVASLADLGYQVNMSAADPFVATATVQSSAAAATGSGSTPQLQVAYDALFALVGTANDDTRPSRHANFPPPPAVHA